MTSNNGWPPKISWPCVKVIRNTKRRNPRVRIVERLRPTNGVHHPPFRPRTAGRPAASGQPAQPPRAKDVRALRSRLRRAPGAPSVRHPVRRGPAKTRPQTHAPARTGTRLRAARSRPNWPRSCSLAAPLRAPFSARSVASTPVKGRHIELPLIFFNHYNSVACVCTDPHVISFWLWRGGRRNAVRGSVARRGPRMRSSTSINRYIVEDRGGAGGRLEPRRCAADRGWGR